MDASGCDYTNKLKVSILVPCYNEEAVLKQFYQRTTQVMMAVLIIL